MNSKINDQHPPDIAITCDYHITGFPILWPIMPNTERTCATLIATTLLSCRFGTHAGLTIRTIYFPFAFCMAAMHPSISIWIHLYQLKTCRDGALMTAWTIAVTSFKTMFHFLPPHAHQFIPNTSMIISVWPILHHKWFKTWSPSLLFTSNRSETSVRNIYMSFICLIGVWGRSEE